MIDLADLPSNVTFTREDGYELIRIFAPGEPICMIPEFAQAVRLSHPLSTVHQTADRLYTFRLGESGVLCWRTGGLIANFYNQMVPVGGIYVACGDKAMGTNVYAAENVRERLLLPRELPTTP